MDGHSSCAPRTVGPRVQFSCAWWPARHTAGGHLLSVVHTVTDQSINQSINQHLLTSGSTIWASLNPALANGRRSQIKEDTINPSVPAREFNLKAYGTIHLTQWSGQPGPRTRLADNHSQAARTATLPTAPPRQACEWCHMKTENYGCQGVDLLSGCQHDGAMHMWPILNMTTGQVNSQLTGINWPVICPIAF